jgi:uncharacterized protein YggE
MRSLAISFLCIASLCFAQTSPEQHTISVTGDAEVKVVLNRVTIMFGVETRDNNLEIASSKTDAAVKQVIQTDLIQVSISYDEKAHGIISYYTTNKGIQVVLKDASKFESVLQAGLKAGATRSMT